MDSSQSQNFPEPAEHEILRQHYPEQPEKQTVETYRDRLQLERLPLPVKDPASE